jgi:phosphonate transport system substrate-binding protein
MAWSRKSLFAVSAALTALAGFFVSSVGGVEVLANPTAVRSKQTVVAQNPKSLTIVFPTRSDSTDLQSKANAVAAFLSKELGMPVIAQVGDDTAAVEALRANRADIAFLSSRPALKAEQLANAKLYLAEVRENYSGGSTYNSVFVVPANSALKGKNTGKATLEQLRGKKMAFTSPTSGSGFIFPTSELVRLGLVQNRDRLGNFFGQVSYGGNYSKALQAVLRGQAEVAAVSEYALFPPYITNEERGKLRILHKIPGVPAHGIAIDDDVSPGLRQKVIAAMLKLNQPGNNPLLRNLYNSTKLVTVNHNRHLAPVRDALKRAGIDP